MPHKQIKRLLTAPASSWTIYHRFQNPSPLHNFIWKGYLYISFYLGPWELFENRILPPPPWHSRILQTVSAVMPATSCPFIHQHASKRGFLNSPLDGMVILTALLFVTFRHYTIIDPKTKFYLWYSSINWIASIVGYGSLRTFPAHPYTNRPECSVFI